MQNKKEKVVDGTKVSLGLLTESILQTATDAGKELIKDTIADNTKELLIDTVGSLIPGVAGAVSSYKRIRAEKNLEILIYYLQAKNEQVFNNLYNQTEENRNKLDKVLEYIIDIVVEEYQEEKIKYMANGYLNLTEHIDVSEDFVMHYYDMIKQLRVVDISVLRLYFRQKYHFIDKRMAETYQDVLDRHNISIEQYKSVRENLLRMGLLELKIKDNLESDMSSLEAGINKIVKYLDHINKGKKSRIPKYSEVKIKQKTRENIKVSKFGTEFYNFFINEMEE